MLLIYNLAGQLIKSVCFFVVNHAEGPCHNKLQEGEYPSPSNTADKRRVQYGGVGSENGQGKVEAEEEDREGDNEFFLFLE